MTKKISLIAAVVTLLAGLSQAPLAPAQAGEIRSPSDWGYDLSGIEIRRIGNDKIFFREFQNRAMHNALVMLAQRGVPRGAVSAITIDTQGGDSGGNFFGGGHGFVQYDLWVRVEGCAKNIMFNARHSGSITTMYDKGGCLAA